MTEPNEYTGIIFKGDWTLRKTIMFFSQIPNTSVEVKSNLMSNKAMVMERKH